MTYSKYLWALTGTALLSLSACSSVSQSFSNTSTSNESNTPLERVDFKASHWQVESINQSGIIDFSHVSVSVNSTSENVRISGSTGCNQFTGALNTSGALQDENEKSQLLSLKVDRISLTKKLCAPALMKQEQKFVQALLNATHYAIVENTWLVVYDDDKNERIKAVVTQSLQSTSAKTENESVEKPSPRRDVSNDNSTDTQTMTNNVIQPSAKKYECRTPTANIALMTVNTLSSNTLALSLNNVHHIVQLSRSASGAKYTNNKGVVFWNKGDEATLSINSGFYQCSLTS
ncbi:META domain-containing protein [Alteromonas gracilis]|uniref:META domain-containing protein n=1 Tax=Alteromonas gracilis TaxID=1479524 RepID=UPI00373564E1